MADATMEVTPMEMPCSYETQFFGFTPTSFSNGVFNAFNQFISDGLATLKQYILSEHSDVMSEAELNDGMSRIQEKIEAKFDCIFDTFEHYLMENVMKIPPHVVLPEDQIQQVKLKSEDENIEQQIEDLKETILAAKFSNTSLAQELEVADKTQEELDKILNKLDECEAIINASELKDTAAQAIEEVERLVNVMVHDI